MDVRGRHLEHRDGVLGDGGGGDDHARRALDGQVAHAEAQAGAQVFARSFERDQVVQRDHHRAARAQQRAVDPGGVEHVDAPGPVGVDQLTAAALGLRAERGAQGPCVASDAAGPGRRSAVEGNPHGAINSITRSA